MRPKLLPLLVAAGSVLALVGPGAAPVAALTCAEPLDGTPQAIASGTERLWGEERFFDHYDFAVIGTVTGIRTIETAGAPDYGATTITVGVEGLLGKSTAPEQIDISSPDPGWMSGYPYQVGTTYFIPVQTEGPAGQPNYSFLCDPISEVEPGVTGELGALAADAGISLSTPDPAPPKEAAVPDAAAVGSNSSFEATALMIAVCAITLAAILAVIALRSRTRSARTAA